MNHPSPYLADLLDQPGALRRTVAALAPSDRLLRIASPRRPVVLTGMGASFHALVPLDLALTAARIPCRLVEAGELLRHMPALLRPDALLVVASQSGRSGEVVRLVERPGPRPAILAVTNDPGSPLARAADATVAIQAGAESTVSCKTYVATLAAVAWLTPILRGDAAAIDLGPVIAAAEEYLGAWAAHVDVLRRLLCGVRQVFVVGRGPSRAAAGFGGLVLKEAARFPSEGMTAGAFRHGPLEMVDDATFVLVLEGDAGSSEANQRLVADVRGLGGRAALVGPGADEPALRVAPEPILEALPLQMVSLALAALRGITAGVFVRATKVTVIE